MSWWRQGKITQQCALGKVQHNVPFTPDKNWVYSYTFELSHGLNLTNILQEE